MNTQSAKNEKIPAWDLSDLYTGHTDPAIENDIASALLRAKEFGARYRGKIHSDSLTASFLFDAVSGLEKITECVHKILAYAYLMYASDTSKQEYGAFLARMQEKATEINKHVLFFELEWVGVSDSVAEQLLGEETLSRYRHYLEKERIEKPHKLSEPEEKILSEKNNTGSEAFSRLFDEIGNNIVFKMRRGKKTEKMSESEILAFLYHSDRTLRKSAADALTKGLQENKTTLTFIFNTILQDCAIDDRLRSFGHPMAFRNLENEISQDIVDAFLKVSEEHYDIPHRYYELKKKVLGLDVLYDYDRYAPVVFDEKRIAFSDAKRMVLDSFGVFSQDARDIAEKFFVHKWIDAAPRKGKRGGAFSHGTVPSAHPYVLVNYMGRLRDVMTLAHELGHGIHQYLSRKQGLFGADTPLPTAETASVFAEILLFDSLKKQEKDPKKKMALIMGKLEEIFATVYRQVIFTRFEERVHRERREKGEIPTEHINELWIDENKKMFGGSLTLTKEYAWWWLYIPHFIHSPFYCYAYSFGELLVLALYQKYLEEGQAFVPGYMSLLSAGGSDAPHILLKKHVGVDIIDPAFWNSGIRIMREMLKEAEEMYATLS
ncbi:MAG: M3 family oligoendopeptidase [bacterium]|nr:M3 family oligoendopeptidase [bacterium]